MQQEEATAGITVSVAPVHAIIDGSTTVTPQLLVVDIAVDSVQPSSSHDASELSVAVQAMTAAAERLASAATRIKAAVQTQRVSIRNYNSSSGGSSSGGSSNSGSSNASCSVICNSGNSGNSRCAVSSSMSTLAWCESVALFMRDSGFNPICIFICSKSRQSVSKMYDLIRKPW
jgi:hypothetical protein